MSKCFCHFNGYEVKDAKARKAIEEILNSLPDSVPGEICEQNNGVCLKMWVGTTEEYNNLQEIENNCIYYITDDNEVEKAINWLEKEFRETEQRLVESAEQTEQRLVKKTDAFIEAAVNHRGRSLLAPNEAIIFNALNNDANLEIPDISKYNILEIKGYSSIYADDSPDVPFTVLVSRNSDSNVFSGSAPLYYYDESRKEQWIGFHAFDITIDGDVITNFYSSSTCYEPGGDLNWFNPIHIRKITGLY